MGLRGPAPLTLTDRPPLRSSTSNPRIARRWDASKRSGCPRGAGEDSSIEPYLYTSGQPEPDLILRTSGEIRLGGFLLWQSAYSEFYFCDANWPALRKIDLLRALRDYNLRQRRLGR